MLTQLIEHLDKTESIPQKFKELEKKASTPPTCSDEIFELLKMCRFRFDEKEYPALKQSEVFVAFLECKQVLIESDSYYYI